MIRAWFHPVDLRADVHLTLSLFGLFHNNDFFLSKECLDPVKKAVRVSRLIALAEADLIIGGCHQGHGISGIIRKSFIGKRLHALNHIFIDAAKHLFRRIGAQHFNVHVFTAAL